MENQVFAWGIPLMVIFQQLAMLMLSLFVFYLVTAIPRHRIVEFFEERMPDKTVKFSQNRLKQFEALQAALFFLLMDGSGIIEIESWVPWMLLIYSASVAAVSKIAESYKSRGIPNGGGK